MAASGVPARASEERKFVPALTDWSDPGSRFFALVMFDAEPMNTGT